MSIKNFNNFFHATMDIENDQMDVLPRPAWYELTAIERADWARDFLVLFESIYEEARNDLLDELSTKPPSTNTNDNSHLKLVTNASPHDLP